jgi:hypothetical protein
MMLELGTGGHRGVSVAMYMGVQPVHSVIKFSYESVPEWLRNSLWCASRFDIVPHD